MVGNEHFCEFGGVAAWDCAHCPVRSLALVREAESGERDAIVGRFARVRCGAGGTIYSEGDRAAFVYVVRSGLLKLTRCAMDGTERILRLPRTGDTIGLEALTIGHYRHTAVALTRIEACGIPVDVLREQYERRPAMLLALLAEGERALDQADRALEELTAGPARRRVARLLLNTTCDATGHCCHVLPREELGAVLGITTETASRVIADMKRQRILTRERRGRDTVWSCDRAALERIAGSGGE